MRGGVKERKGVNETPRSGGSMVVSSVPWTGSLFIAAEVGFGPLSARLARHPALSTCTSWPT
ncbi:hypothetical protein HKD37_15G044236 [Glycine soja]